MPRRVFTVSLLFVLALPLLLVGGPAGAAALAPGEVPEPLRPWIGWALHGEEDRVCPFLYSNARLRSCAWPDRLELRLDDPGGRFRQAWTVHARSWIELPGDGERWPQEVSVNGKAVSVAERKGRPALELPEGRHVLEGRFLWSRLPESLPLPRTVGLVALEVAGKAVPFPDITPDGSLWLRGERETAGRDGGERLAMEVFRRIVDEIPLQVETRIELDVAGRQRELLVGPGLLTEAIPVRLDSPLPARLEPDGRLRVQVRPGRYALTLATRQPGPVDTLPLPAIPEPWPGEEVWAFDSRPHLRLVEVSGGTPVDPRQTRLPGEWQSLPAFRLQGGEQLVFEEIRRGDPQPEPDRLTLERQLWLDFDGGGYTVQDRITGSMTQGWRLTASPELALGQAVLDGEPRLITTLPGEAGRGVELRRGAIELLSDSRLEGPTGTLPATGWAHEFREVRATLHLPPGWTLLGARGADHVAPTWLQRWTLLDLFLVLVAALAVARLNGWPWGLLALATLALIWHEQGAPQWVWLNLLAAAALLRVLPTGRFRRAALWYRNLSLLALVLIALPFLVAQVRVGLYPQLERPWALEPAPPARSLPAQAPAPAMVMEEAQALREKMLAQEERARGLEDKAYALGSVVSSPPLEYRVPGDRLQTGPGVPDWRWSEAQLRWSGPVDPQEAARLTLLGPGGNLVLHWLRALLVVALGLHLAGLLGKARGRAAHGGTAPRGTAALLLPLLLVGAVTPAPVQADIPDAALLEELRQRLLAPPECLPACAQVARLRVEVEPARLTLRLEVHAQARVAVPLPGQANQWLPTEVAVDGRPVRGLLRAADGGLQIELAPGAHQLLLAGPLPPRDALQLGLPLRPKWAEVRARGWTVDGIHADGSADPQLQLTRVRTSTAGALPALQPGALPSFVRVERSLRLGLDWRVETRIVRLSPGGEAVVLEVPLLPGESVITEGIRVSEGKVLVNMRESVLLWQSILEPTEGLSLRAPQTTAWAEFWRLDAAPVWHVELGGIPVVHHQDPAGRWLPEWRPWPGEEVTLKVTRPQGVSGPTLTVDSSRLVVTPGERATDARLALALRSSQGGQHTLMLPPQAMLQSVLIDGVAQPVRQEGRAVTLPLAPTAQQVELLWREGRGVAAHFATPQVDLGLPSVNARIELNPGQGRWVLFTGGPQLGPAVLFWGVLLVVLLAAAGLARVRLTPLRFHHWLLLGIGLTQTPALVAVIVVGWLLALGARDRLQAETPNAVFNLVQTALGTLTVVALGALFFAVQQGLLGYPEMQIAGNGSNAYRLAWYQDRAGELLPGAWVWSLPLWVYRLLMLAWALWLAFALLGWLRWGWGCFSRGGLWRQVRILHQGTARPAGTERPAEKP